MPLVYRRLLRELSAGRPCVLASIIDHSGSSPRSRGTKFLICQDFSLVGSIGGGILEAHVIKAAESLIGSDLSRVMEIHMTGNEVAGTDMICGGKVDILVQGITPENIRTIRVLEQMLRKIKDGGKGILILGPLPDKGCEAELDISFYSSNGKVLGAIKDDKDLMEFVEQRAIGVLGSKTSYLFRVGSGGRTIVFDPIFSRPSVIIFGAGHISVHLAPLLSMADFRVVIVDDRGEFANRERFPRADEIVAAEFGDCFDILTFTPETYCVIVTRGHLQNRIVLKHVLARS